MVLRLTEQELHALTGGFRGEPLSTIPAGMIGDGTCITLPWPPSLNHNWRNVGDGKVVRSATYRTWQRAAARQLLLSGLQWREPISYRMAVDIKLYPPTRASFDADNKIKPCLDLLVKQGIISDDAQVRRIVVEKFEPERGHARATVTINRYEGSAEHES